MISRIGNQKLQTSVRLALAGSMLASFGVAHAQSAPANAQNTVLDDVVVTGSRLAVPNEISISPVVAVGAADIEQTGVTRIEDLLNSLPQVFAAQGSNVSNGSNGTAEVDLRGLGAQRTLVLVNGRRLGPGDPGGGSASDLNQVPAELIERIDLLTGGASSVYGADAVSGVVNFVLNTHFEGVKISTNYGFYNHSQHNPQGAGDAVPQFNSDTGANFATAPGNVNTGQTKDLSFLLGFNSGDGKGNATMYATYRKVAPVLQASYDYSACTLNSGYVAGSYDSGGKFSCGGSSSAATGRFIPVDPATGEIIGGSKTVGPNGLTKWNNSYRYNYGPINYFQRPDERYSAGAFVHYEFNEHADVYSEVQYMNDRSIAQIAPTAFFFGAGLANSTCGNPLFSAAELDAWCGGVADPNKPVAFLLGRRNVEGGPRQDDLGHQSLRLVIGTKGIINNAWSYDTYGQFGYTQLVENYNNDVSLRRMNNALDVVQGPNGPECRSVQNGTDPTCVPWNIWNYGGVTPAATNYIGIPLLIRGEVQQFIVSGNVTGDLGKYGWQLPTAKSGVRVNVGAEWRQVKSTYTPDLEYQSGDCGNCGGTPILPLSGEIASRELFMEARVPLIDNASLAKSLAFETGYRYSSYSLGFNTNTFKFGLEWSPVDEVRLRASFAHAVRAPNVGELYSPQQVGLDGVTDPCTGPNPSYTAAQCARTGVSASQYGNIIANPAVQYNGFIGGNTELKPETALTSSFGVGYTPQWLPNFRAQIDYFDLKINDVIQRIGADTILKECLNNGVLCDLVHRDINGSLWLSNNGYVVDKLANVGTLEEKGIDVDLSYTFQLGAYGKIHTALLGTYLQAYKITPIAADSSTGYDCAGYYGNICGTPNAEWRHTLRTTWQTPWKGLDLSLAWRHFNAVKVDALSGNSNLAAQGTIATGAISNTDAELGARDYLDLTAAIKASDKLTLRLGIQNLLDKDPPVFGNSDCPGSQCNGNTFPQVYDALGRYVFATLTAQF